MHRRVWWAAALAAVMLVPVVITEVRTGSHLWATLSSGLGVLALSALIATVVAPSRIRSLTAAFGVERILGLHRWLGILAVVLVVMHLLVAVTGHPQLINPGTLTGAAKAGWSSTAALLLTGWVAVRARRPGARYEFWARAHVGLAAAGLVLAALHVLWLGHLVADPVMRVVLSALLMVLLAVLAHRWVWRPLFSRQGAYVVYGVRRESPTVCTLVLAPVHVRRGGLRFSAGQFVWLRLRRGVVGTEEHPFTIASSANVTGRLELTVRDSGDFSAVLACLHTGCKVWLDGPHGSFTADVGTAAESDGLVLLAGGVGITPMMSMLRTLAERSDRRTHRLVVAERGAEPLFADELTALSRRLDLRVTRTEGRRIDAALLAEVVPDPAERQRLEYFVCGSPSITTGSLAALEQLGVPPVRIHTEQFGWTGAVPVPAPRDGTGPTADQAGKTQTGPTHAGPAPRSRTGGRRRAG